jgi:hypothetical protein
LAKRFIQRADATIRSANDLPDLVREHISAGSALIVFDFDGVLSSNSEEQVYQAVPEPDERGALERLAAEAGIVPELYDTRYLRHMIYQKIMHDIGAEIEPGPLLPLAQQLTRKGVPYYILTARSSPPAVARVLGFCEAHQLKPQELFFVGRVGKGRQLHLVGRGDSSRRIIYFEDSQRHVRNSTSLAYDPLTTVYVVWDDTNAPEVGRRTFAEALSRYLTLKGAGSGDERELPNSAKRSTVEKE